VLPLLHGGSKFYLIFKCQHHVDRETTKREAPINHSRLCASAIKQLQAQGKFACKHLFYFLLCLKKSAAQCLWILRLGDGSRHRGRCAESRRSDGKRGGARKV
jgi:hypothetical protein